ncbi:MAG: TetR/AcrR family transcriptional regulator [Rhodoplanes sp.]|uniref:TetR/AcrR family transcriptional regulator n=1 Tax=Rhodoplanes sp. TaxID=1968906 RepID=UPI0017BDD48B|nr:TetR/AcrR family transcriptional regulator [Rhodoplanes sp.]NVO14275.1 TetR/AcrR family transcriptional regulator [Rhodoplanes sp.]
MDEPSNGDLPGPGPASAGSPECEHAARRASIGARRNPATEAAILEAARGLLAEKGYAGFSIDEVARRAGAGKPTIYRWWPSKADLFIAVYAADKAAAIAVPDTGDLADDLVAYTTNVWRFWRESVPGAAFRALIAEAQATGSALEVLREKFLPARLCDLESLFTHAAARGEIAADDVEGLLRLYIGFHWFQLLTGRIDEDPALIARMVGLIVRAGRSGRPA